VSFGKAKVRAAVMSLVAVPPRLLQPLHAPPLRVLVHTAPSAPRAKIRRLPAGARLGTIASTSPVTVRPGTVE
jgi:hypothetical protein